MFNKIIIHAPKLLKNSKISQKIGYKRFKFSTNGEKKGIDESVVDSKKVVDDIASKKVEEQISHAHTEEVKVKYYSRTLSLLHWVMGISAVGALGTVKIQQNVKDKELKMKLMGIHKSFGTTVAALLIPRIAIKIMTKSPGRLPGANSVEHFAANVGHAAMYGFLIFLPVTGVAMGYFGGKGLPFWNWHIPGASEENKRGDIAKQAYQLHKQVGYYFQFAVPLHVGAAGFHVLKGAPILKRINPFRL